MIGRHFGWLLAALMATAPTAIGQVPGVPAAPAAVPGAPALPGATAAGVGAPGAAGFGAAGATGAAAPAAGPRNIWSFFMMTPAQKLQHQQNSAICRAKICSSKLGQFLNNMLLPMSAMTGGMVGPLCPGPLAANPADLMKPATSPQGAAARIKAEEAQVKEKIAAIEYLATVDCHYYSEAEAALIVGLRAEKNECVRLAAARALATGCCCTPKILKALTITVNGSTEDKFPSERSELVRTFAYVALERCLHKCIEGEAEPPPEPPPAAKQAMADTLVPFGASADPATAVVVAAYFAPSGGEIPAKTYEAARRTLAKGLHLSPQTISRLSGPKNVMDATAPPNRSTAQVARPRMEASETVAVTNPTPFAATLPPAGAEAVPAPVTQAVANTRTGRGNLLNIFQDTRRK